MRPLLTAFGDTLVITRRNLIRIPRAPDLLIGFTVQEADPRELVHLI